jgi:hypothetical protein
MLFLLRSAYTNLQRALKQNREVGLSLPLRVGLAVYGFTKIWIIQARIDAAISSREDDSIKDVEKLHLEFGPYVLTEGEVLGSRNVLVVTESISYTG